MSELKTKPTDANVDAFLSAVDDAHRRKDCLELLAMMTATTHEAPTMWGSSIIGFGAYHYKRPTGHQGDWFRMGFSPRKRDLTLYFLDGFDGHEELMAALGKHKRGVCCLYIKSLDDIDRKVLKRLMAASCKRMKALHA